MTHSTWRDQTEHGGHKPFGSDTLHTIYERLSKASPKGFKGHSLRAEWDTEGIGKTTQRVYRVWHYSTILAEWWPGLDGGTFHLNMTTYSKHTTRYQNLIHVHLWHHNLRFNGPPSPHVVEWFDVWGDTYGLSDGSF